MCWHLDCSRLFHSTRARRHAGSPSARNFAHRRQKTMQSNRANVIQFIAEILTMQDFALTPPEVAGQKVAIGVRVRVRELAIPL